MGYDDLNEMEFWDIGYDASNDERGAEFERKKALRSSPDQEQRRLLTNSRERRRQKTLNMAFQSLRDIVPTYPKETKLSKYGILKAAIKYINFLDEIRSRMEEDMERKARSWSGQ